MPSQHFRPIHVNHRRFLDEGSRGLYAPCGLGRTALLLLRSRRGSSANPRNVAMCDTTGLEYGFVRTRELRGPHRFLEPTHDLPILELLHEHRRLCGKHLQEHRLIFACYCGKRGQLLLPYRSVGTRFLLRRSPTRSRRSIMSRRRYRWWVPRWRNLCPWCVPFRGGTTDHEWFLGGSCHRLKYWFSFVNKSEMTTTYEALHMCVLKGHDGSRCCAQDERGTNGKRS